MEAAVSIYTSVDTSDHWADGLLWLALIFCLTLGLLSAGAGFQLLIG
jgi:hypothetical protein